MERQDMWYRDTQETCAYIDIREKHLGSIKPLVLSYSEFKQITA